MTVGFVGREEELARLDGLLEEVRGGEQRVALVCGDPGIGKTALVEEACARAGLRTYWGRCWEGGGAPPYWPWMQVVRACVAELGDAALSALGPRAADLTPLLPEGRARNTDGEGATARIPMFEAVAALLERAASDGGLIVALDDLHAADEGTLHVLRHVSRDGRPVPLLVVATYRVAEVAASEAHVVALDAVSRQGTTIRLGGLEPDQVAEILERTGTSADAALVRKVQEATEGNPFLVYEASRMLAVARPAGAASIEVPAAAQGLIHQRLESLRADDRAVLSAAAVLGREFAVAELAHLVGRPADDLLDVLERATESVVVDQVGLGRCAFHHSLLRESLLADLSRDDRTRLHRQAGEAVEEADPSNASRIAHHYLQAALGVGRADLRAVEACASAGDWAHAALAFEEAAHWYESALQVLGTDESVAFRRYELQLAIGNALLMTDVRRARNAFCDAIRTARGMGRIDLAAEAVLPVAPQAVSDVTLIGTLDDALCELPDEDSPLRAKILVTFARLLNNSSFDWDVRKAISRQGLEMARRVGDVETRWTCMWQWHQNMFVDVYSLDERLVVSEELLELAPQTGNRRHRAMALAWRTAGLLEVGDLAGALAVKELLAAEASKTREPFVQWFTLQYFSQAALHMGRLDEAEELAREALAAGRRAEWWAAEGAYRSFSWMMLRLRGVWDELEQAARDDLTTWTAGAYSDIYDSLIRALVGQGRLEEARHYFEECLARGVEAACGIVQGPEGTPRLRRSVSNAGPLGELCFLFGDVERGRVIYEPLLPHAARQVTFGEGGLGGVCARYLGLLARLLGRAEKADRHFTTGAELHECYGARLWGTITHIDHAEMLLERDGPGDRTRAAELLTAARAACADMGLEMYEARAAEQLAALASPPHRSDHPHFVHEGEYWTVFYRGRTMRVRDTRGVRYVARLTERPGQEVAALDLAGGLAERTIGVDGVDKEFLREASDASDAGPVLDARAKTAYRRRLEELQANGGDEEEAALIAAQLSGAVGMGGRDRRTGSDAERARQAVTRAIRNALDRLHEDSPELADHLRASVHTGNRCVYRP